MRAARLEDAKQTSRFAHLEPRRAHGGPVADQVKAPPVFDRFANLQMNKATERMQAVSAENSRFDSFGRSNVSGDLTGSPRSEHNRYSYQIKKSLAFLDVSAQLVGVSDP